VGRFAAEREAAETFAAWLARAGGPAAVAEGLADLAEFPSPADAPGWYVDYDETGPFNAEIGLSECAG
jgi:hypothetical protein